MTNDLKQRAEELSQKITHHLLVANPRIREALILAAAETIIRELVAEIEKPNIRTKRHDLQTNLKRAEEMIEIDGWNYRSKPSENDTNKDARKIVTLSEQGMIWVGIRAWHPRGYWINNGEPERAEIIAWRDLYEPARGRFYRGILHIPTVPHIESEAERRAKEFINREWSTNSVGRFAIDMLRALLEERK